MGAQEQVMGDEQPYEVPAEIREPSFPLALRGYSSEAVDAYVKRVTAELEVQRSPRAAVRHALESVGEQVGGILQRARDAGAEVTAAANREAEEITARARAEATDLVAQARAQADRERAHAEQALAQARAAADAILNRANSDAAEIRRRAEEEMAALREQAQTRLDGLRSDTEAVRGERQRLLDNARETAARLEAMVTRAAMEYSDTGTESTPERAAVVAVEPGGDVATKRRPRATRPSRG